ncbi:hypothetical protein H0X48_03880 [Candidatus Dependentiae bacterium]|nr:hypothetical protein [Candidatus Dependentiae bacterium]
MLAKQKTTIHSILLIHLVFFGGLKSFCKSPIAPKSLIIILDRDYEETCAKSLEQDGYDTLSRPEGVGAITSTLIVALHQQAAPIVTSKSLLQNIQDHTTILEDFILKNRTYIFKKYNSFKRFSSQELIKQFRIQATYTTTMYDLVNNSLKNLLNTTSQQELLKTLKNISNSPTFSIEQAPLLFTQALTNRYHKTCYNELTTYMLCMLTLKQLHNWRLYSISQDMCVLVPSKTLQQNLKPLQSQTHTKFSPLEYATGFKLSLLPEFTLKPGRDILTCSYKPLSLILKKLFITTQEYKKSGYKPLCWNIYLTGHGSASTNYQEQQHYYQLLEKHYQHNPQKNKTETYRKLQTIKEHIKKSKNKIPEGTIATLPIHEFRELLLFFHTQLTVNLLFYASCYAGGYHLEIPFMYNKKPLRLNYTIIAGSVAECPIKQSVPSLALPPYRQVKNGTHTTIYGITPESIDLGKKSLTLTTKLCFNSFFSALKKQLLSKHLFIKALESVHVYHDKNSNLLKEYACNIPWIRHKNTMHFKLLLSSKKTCPHLSLATQKDLQTPLIFTSPMPWQLYNNPCYISQLQTHSDTLQDIVGALLPIDDLKASRVIFIKKLICKSSPLLPRFFDQATTELTNVLFCYGIPDCDTLTINTTITSYFTYQSTHYKVIFKNDKSLSLQKNHSDAFLAFIQKG